MKNRTCYIAAFNGIGKHAKHIAENGAAALVYYGIFIVIVYIGSYKANVNVSNIGVAGDNTPQQRLWGDTAGKKRGTPTTEETGTRLSCFLTQLRLILLYTSNCCFYLPNIHDHLQILHKLFRYNTSLQKRM